MPSSDHACVGAYRVGCAREDAQAIREHGCRLRPGEGWGGGGYERSVCPARGFENRASPIADVPHAIGSSCWGAEAEAPWGLTASVSLQQAWSCSSDVGHLGICLFAVAQEAAADRVRTAVTGGCSVGAWWQGYVVELLAEARQVVELGSQQRAQACIKTSIKANGSAACAML